VADLVAQAQRGPAVPIALMTRITCEAAGAGASTRVHEPRRPRHPSLRGPVLLLLFHSSASLNCGAGGRKALTADTSRRRPACGDTFERKTRNPTLSSRSVAPRYADLAPDGNPRVIPLTFGFALSDRATCLAAASRILLSSGHAGVRIRSLAGLCNDQADKAGAQRLGRRMHLQSSLMRWAEGVPPPLVAGGRSASAEVTQI
jgi:hypothetical protein